MSVQPSDLIRCEDPTAAYILNRNAWVVGSFMEAVMETFRNASLPGSKKGERKSPSEFEVAEYRRALMDGTPYKEANVRKMKSRGMGGKKSLRDAGKLFGGDSGGIGKGMVLSQRMGGRINVDEPT